MNSKLKISAAILLVFVSVVGSKAQFGAMGAAPGAATPQFDPTTGMPIPTAVPDWKDPNWKDPDIILTNVAFDGISVSEVGNFLRDKFHNEFDVVVPKHWGSAQAAAGQMSPGTMVDWADSPVSLQLKNVAASEIFNAMNLVFENDRVPLRWELKLIGNRRIALLRVLIDPGTQSPGVQISHRIYYIGNLIGDEKNGGMTMDQIIKTVTDVWQMADRSGKGVTTSAAGVEISGGTIQFHKDAQLLVVTGTGEQIDFVEQTLKALTQKSEQEKMEHSHKSGTGGELKTLPK